MGTVVQKSRSSLFHWIRGRWHSSQLYRCLFLWNLGWNSLIFMSATQYLPFASYVVIDDITWEEIKILPLCVISFLLKYTFYDFSMKWGNLAKGWEPSVLCQRHWGWWPLTLDHCFPELKSWKRFQGQRKESEPMTSHQLRAEVENHAWVTGSKDRGGGIGEV